ncbi:bifunctional diaminohydroxyphosphoribosylaminopyrimidine deaminase/5-amino-6-(5-phosphoribosylamino)uracil reductase RibD, partial [candidate division GN15 bacterium]|nr:bifunctional diaminohydroxyphosphoribosylaminopyrimidine deaminase/5-amino-6-(5-phosphoribosylamino)uracil reductase RibD [candidate division GN15 bacterium]
TMYVTLEPCCHVGRTGPCTEAIRQAGIARVVYAVNDPDHRVNCRGGKCLVESSIEVESGVLEDEARQLNEAYFGYHANARPWVILKMAQTLDGRIATSTGDSQWISGEASLHLAHRLRSEVDAVVVGMGTVRKDNPSLTVRHVRGTNPYRIVLTSSARMPRNCKLLDENHDYKTIIAASAEAADRLARSKRARNTIIWKLKTNRQGSADTRDLLKQADRFGIRSLLLEGGSAVATTFLKRRLVDKLVMVTAPMILGDGTSTVGDLRIRRLARSITFRDYSFGRCNGDSVFIGYPVWS